MRGQSRIVAVVFVARRAKALLTATFDDSVSTGSLAMHQRFGGSATVGNLVIFAPFDANAAGAYDVTTGTFDEISTGGLALSRKFADAVAVGNLVVFAPYSANVVG
eukprot:1864845-Prymnesium_polylepis.1